MNARNTVRYDMFARAKTNCLLNSGDFAPTEDFHKEYPKLAAICAALTKSRAQQESDGDATARSVILDGLRIDIRNITRTASSLDESEPGLAAKFPAPKSNSDAELITATDFIISNLHAADTDDAATKTAKAALVAKFVSKSLPADFLTQLMTERDLLNTAEETQEGSREEGIKGTTKVDTLIREGMKVWRALNAIMHNKYSRVPEKLRAWKSASHIERLPRATPKTPAPAPAGKPAQT